jgi:acyl-homoserine-lactone acylase
MRRQLMILLGLGALAVGMMWSRDAVTLLGSAFGTAVSSAAGDLDLKAEIRTTSYGIPHVIADDFAGVGFGLGYSFAKSDLCTVADRWLTVRAQRSRYLGPDGTRNASYDDPSLRRDGGQNFSNLESDFFWKRILDLDVLGHDLAQPPPIGPTPEVRELVRGYAAGYNRYLTEVGVDNIPDPRCRGQEWVVPITERDVYLRAMHWNLYNSVRSMSAPLRSIVDAAPPSSNDSASDAKPVERAALVLPPNPDDDPEAHASNLIALGKDATVNGRGMLFSNPHWRWHEPERWFEAHLTVPGRMNAYGATLEGTPAIIFGFNTDVAWTHTASVPRRETIYELRLAPQAPTSYMYEGKVRQMTSRTVTVDVKEANGQLAKRSWTFWETHNGPVIENATYAWTPTTAYAVRNLMTSFRWLNQQLAMMQSKSVKELDDAGKKYLGIGWLNTAAADSGGHALYADRTAIPHVTKSMLDACVTSDLGKSLLREQRVMVLDGWRADCEWGSDRGTPVPGILSVDSLPLLTRDDYVMNSNDSHWVNNPRQPLEGYGLIIGDERTPRSLRTRQGLVKIESRLKGADGHPGTRFTLEQLETITMNNRVLSAELWRDPLVAMCRTMPGREGVSEACDILARWDLTENLDSPGAVLWRRFMDNLAAAGLNVNSSPELYLVPFDPRDPINTPRGLNADNPNVGKALVAAIGDLRSSGVRLDAKLRDYQFEERSGVRIPIPGGTGTYGQFNPQTFQSGWVPGQGWHTPVHGSTYVMWVHFTDNGPVARTINAASQSDNPQSANHADQTRLFSERKSKQALFADAAIRSDPNLATVRICGTPGDAYCR